MSTCPACGASLEGQWKFCLRCGAPLLESTPADEVDVVPVVVPTPAEDTLAAPMVAPTPTDDTPAAPMVAPTPTDDIPAAIRPAAEAPAVAPVNTLAIVALALGIIGGPVAIIFGHVALRQIRQTGQRGRTAAIVATVLGYLWLLGWAGVITWVLVTGGR